MAAENGAEDHRAERSVRDPRIDRGISWVLTAVAAAAMAFLGSEVRTMNDKIEALTVKMAVVEAARYGERMERAEARLTAIESTRGGVR